MQMEKKEEKNKNTQIRKKKTCTFAGGKRKIIKMNEYCIVCAFHTPNSDKRSGVRREGAGGHVE